MILMITFLYYLSGAETHLLNLLQGWVANATYACGGGLVINALLARGTRSLPMFNVYEITGLYLYAWHDLYAPYPGMPTLGLVVSFLPWQI
jgi:hypothetical protein